MKPVEIEFLLRDRTEEGLDRMSGNIDGVQAKYNATRATIAALRKEMEKLQGQKLSSGIDSSGNTAQIDALKKKIAELRAEVTALEKEYPELGKTVSGTPLVPPDAQKVKSTYNGLHNSIQQIAGFGSQFVSSVVDFLINAFILFCILKAVNKMLDLGKKKEEPAAPTTKVCPFCKSEIAIDATRCPHCTSEQPKA